MQESSHRFLRGVRQDVIKKYKIEAHVGSGASERAGLHPALPYPCAHPDAAPPCGADGEVWAGKLTTPDERGGTKEESVAIKKIHFCDNTTEAKRILREMRILRHLQHDNIISIRDVLDPVAEIRFSYLWIVFDFVDLDLRKLIASPQTITVAHVQWISHQMLSALLYLHSAHVLHRDLKPANVLLSGTCDVKLCDFGLARVVNEEDWKLGERQLATPTALQRSASLLSCPKVSRQMTTHVVTRWYRAPELILLQRYTTAIDMWSFACIFAELLLMLPQADRSPAERNALFPGQSCFNLSPSQNELATPQSLDQLHVIFKVGGGPASAALAPTAVLLPGHQAELPSISHRSPIDAAATSATAAPLLPGQHAELSDRPATAPPCPRARAGDRDAARPLPVGRARRHARVPLVAAAG